MMKFKTMLYATYVTALLHLLCNVVKITATDCPTNAIVVGNILYDIHEESVDTHAAKKACKQKDGGNLIKMDFENVMTEITRLLDDVYQTKLLRKVWVTTRPGIYFRYSLSQNDEDSSYPWEPYEHYPSFFLYHKSWGSYNSAMWFGKDENVSSEASSWVIASTTNMSAVEDWVEDFVLYGSSSELGAYGVGLFSKSDNESNILSVGLATDVVQGPDGYQPHFGTLHTIIPRVRIGGISKKHSTDWIWISDNSKVINLDVREGSGSSCEQLSLRYDDQWKTDAVDCSETKTPFICESNFNLVSIFLQPDECDGTLLYLTWNATAVADFYSNGLTYYLQVEANGETWKDIAADVGTFTIRNLRKRETFDVKVTIYTRLCEVSLRLQVDPQTTAFGVPDEISSATVRPGENETCLLKWFHESSEITNYEVTVYEYTDSVVTRINYTPLPSDLNTMMNYSFDGSQFENKSVISFKIKATSCAGTGDEYEIAGNCVENLFIENTTYAPSGVLVAANDTVVFAAALTSLDDWTLICVAATATMAILGAIIAGVWYALQKRKLDAKHKEEKQVAS